MTGHRAIFILTAGVFLTAGAISNADTIQLVNGDRLHGTVASLDGKQLVFRSASFGELKIDRSKIALIALGDKGLPETRQAAAAPQAPGSNGQLLSQVAPLLQSPAVQRQVGPMLEQLLGAGGMGDLQNNINEARRGLQDLKKDFGDSPDAKALDAYINLFNLLSPPGPSREQPKPAPQHRTPQPVKPHVAPRP